MKALMDIFEAAEYLGVNHTTMRDYANQCLVAAVKLPKRRDDMKRSDAIGADRRKWQFRKEDLDRFIASRVIEPKTSHQPATGTGGKTHTRVIERDWWKQ